MNLNAFEKTAQEKVTEEAGTSFAQTEALALKQKIEKRKQKKARLMTMFFSLGAVILILLILVGYSQYKLYKLSKEESVPVNAISSASSTSSVIPNTGEQVLKALSRHILLPEGTPQIAEVKDVTKLRETQAFFKDAQNGDIVVVYSTTIIIYRPSKDIIIAEGDISGAGQTKP